MPNELYFQKKLIDAAEKLGGYGFKMSNRFLVGVVDLLIQLPNCPTLLLEVKQKALTPGTKLVNVGLRPLQSAHLAKHLRSGGYGGWVMIAWLPNGERWVMYSPDLGRLKFNIEEYKELSCHMKKTTPWERTLLAIAESIGQSPSSNTQN